MTQPAKPLPRHSATSAAVQPGGPRAKAPLGSAAALKCVPCAGSGGRVQDSAAAVFGLDVSARLGRREPGRIFVRNQMHPCKGGDVLELACHVAEGVWRTAPQAHKRPMDDTPDGGNVASARHDTGEAAP